MHFSEEKAVFEARRSKNPNFREVKREGEKREYGGLEPDNCRSRAYTGIARAYLQDFNIKTSKKMNANFVSKLAFRGALGSLTTTLIQNIVKPLKMQCICWYNGSAVINQK